MRVGLASALGVAASVATIAAAWSFVEPLVPAHRGYVRGTEGPIVERVIRVQLESNREKRERLLSEAKKRELELASPEAAATPQYKQMIQDRVDRVKQELDRVDQSDKTLFDEEKELRK